MVGLYITLFVISQVIAISLICYLVAFYTPKPHQNSFYNIPIEKQYDTVRDKFTEMIDAFAALPYESVSIRSRDRKTLYARYMHQRDGAPLAICLHGYRGTPVRDFCGGGKLLSSLGFNLLLIEQRGHLDSEGHTITFGVKERYDCLDWIDYALKRFGKDVEIILCGVSMGASCALMVTELGLPANVKHIVADSPYTTPNAIIRKICSEDNHIPYWLAGPFIHLGALLFGGFRLGRVDALRAIKQSSLDILLIHGDEDSFVPTEMSYALEKAAPDKVSLYIFKGAGHGISYVLDPKGYTAAVVAYLNRNGIITKTE